MDLTASTLAIPSRQAPSPSYTVLRSLGKGGYGEVFEALDLQLQRRVALKRLDNPGRLPPDALLEEARAAASLTHAAFVRIHAFDAATGSIVMELVDGQSLHRLLQDGPMPVEMALDIVAQVADAMAHAHRAGLVHGDLKPANLMREPSGTVRILDFGLARHVDPLATQSTDVAALCGTLAYMAPERLLGKPLAPAADIYALGVLLYELLCGARPLAHLDGLALAAAQLQAGAGQWRFPAGLPPAVAGLVQAMAAHDAAHRFASMEMVAQAARTLGQAPLPPPAPPSVAALPVAPMPGRRAPWRTAVATSALAGLLLAPATLDLARPGPAPPFSAARAMQAGLAALHAQRDGSVDAAVAHFESILRRAPHHAGAAAGLSLAYSLRYFGNGRDDAWLARADASAQQALAAAPQLALAHVARAWVLEYQGKPEEALEHGRTALRLDPLDLFAQWGQIDLLINERHYRAARQALDAAFATRPAERLLFDLSGRLYFQQGDYAAAEREFRRSIAREPDLPHAYANLYAALLRQDRGDEGLRVLQQGLQAQPDSRLHTSLGTALFARGDYLGAARNFELAVSADRGGPNKYLYWANLADALRWLPGRRDEARHAYRQAVALLRPMLEGAEQDATYQSRMGLYLARLGATREAVQWTSSALRAAPDSGDVHFRAAIVHELAAARDAALGHVREAVRLGYPPHLVAAEPDLLALRRDTRYHQPAERKK